MVEIVRMTSVLLLDFCRLLSILIQNVSQVLLLLIVDVCSLLWAIDAVVLHIYWSLHLLVLAIGSSATLVILMMHRFRSGASVGLRTVNHALATVSLDLYSTLDRKVLSLTLSRLVARTRSRLSIWIHFIVRASDHGVGHALVSLLAVRIII